MCMSCMSDLYHRQLGKNVPIFFEKLQKRYDSPYTKKFKMATGEATMVH